MAGFDPDAYLAQKQGAAFDPDAYLRQKASTSPSAAPAQAQPGLGQALLRGAGQGATLGFEDEIEGALPAAVQGLYNVGRAVGLPTPLGNTDANGQPLGALDVYRNYRNDERARNEAAQTAHPRGFLAGNLAGGALMVPLLPGGAANGLGSLAKTGAALGAVNALGSSNAELTPGQMTPQSAGTAALGTLGGALLGGAIPLGFAGAGAVARPLAGAVAPKVANALSDIAETRAVKALNPLIADVRGLQRQGRLNQLGRRMLDSHVLGTGNLESINQKVADLAEQEGQNIGAIGNKMDELVGLQKPPDVARVSAIPAPGAIPAEYGPAAELPEPPRSYTEMNAPQSVAAGYGPLGPPNPLSGSEPVTVSNPEAAQSAAAQLMADPKVARDFFVRPSVLKQRVENELIGPLADKPVYSNVVQRLRDEAEKLGSLGTAPADAANLPPGLQPVTDYLPFNKVQALKNSYDDFLNFTKEQTPEKEMLKRVRGIINDEMEKRAQALSSRLDPGLADQLMGAKQAYGDFATAQGISADALNRGLRNRLIAPSDYGVGATAGLAGMLTHGTPAGLLLGGAGTLLNKFARERGSALAARGLDALASGATALERAAAAEPSGALTSASLPSVLRGVASGDAQSMPNPSPLLASGKKSTPNKDALALAAALRARRR